MALFLESDNRDAGERIADVFGPSHIDNMIRQAIQSCWISLPKERRTHDELERQIRRLVDRALKDFKEDRQAFGKESDAQS